ncbi:Heterokaryon incompatibility [Fusarium oxysporum f. sp. vasinfectum]|nr:Heterokaryon incompatibility [Fusarium oxysporum f. sp. vasinfectum]
MASPNKDTEASPLVYQPFNKDQREIRPLEILPNPPDGKVNCKLHIVLLTPDLYYTCISYVWGDPNVTEEIIVDGVPRQVTVTLATALRHVKRHWTEIGRKSDPDLDTSKFRLWADALCINQDDLTERLHQVSMMADIYSSAAMVLAWLSSNDDDVIKAFDVFERIVRIAKEKARPIKFAGLTDLELFKLCYGRLSWEPKQLYWLFSHKSTLFDVLNRDIILEGPYGPVFNFCQLNFWNRHSLCFVALVGLDDYMQHMTKTSIESTQRFNIRGLRFSFSRIFHLFFTPFVSQEFIDTNKIPAYGMWHLGLYFALGSEASNDLDYIYGLFAVTKSPIAPDYSKSIREKRAKKQNWEVICKDEWRYELSNFLNSHAVGLKRLYGLPSWAPVFSKADRRKAIVRDPTERRSAFVTVPELFNRLPIAVVCDSLWVKGIKVQVVKTVYEKTISNTLTSYGLQQCIMSFTQSPKDMYPTGKTVLEVLCCTLLRKEAYENYAFDVGLCTGCWLYYSGKLVTSKLGMEWSQKPYVKSVLPEWLEAGRSFDGNKLFTTEDGYIGTMSDDVLPGDVVCVLAGSSELAVLRPEDDNYLFVECCFMIGLMNGEVSEFLASGRAKIETIEIR